MLRPEFVRRKLHLIAEDLGRLVQFKDATFDEIAGDFVKLAAVERLLERIVMRAIDVNEHLVSELATGLERTTRLTDRDTFLRLSELGVYDRSFAERIAKSAGLRNILAHDYNDVDHHVVVGAIANCLEDYRSYLERVDVWLTQQGFAPQQPGAEA